MTLSAPIVNKLDFVTDGVIVSFPLTNLIFKQLSDLIVTYTPTGGVSTLLVAGTHYSIAGNSLAGVANLSTVLPVLVAGKLRVRRKTQPRQEVALSQLANQSFPKVETALDDLARQISDINQGLPSNNSASSISGFDSDGNPTSYSYSEFVGGNVDAKGTLIGRVAYDTKSAGFTYLDIDSRPLVFYMRETAIAATWAGPFLYSQLYASSSFATRNALIAANVASLPVGTIILVRGNVTEGIGPANYKKLNAAPVPVKLWHVQSADGSWFEMAFENSGRKIDPAAFYDGGGDWRPAMNAAYEFVNSKGGGDIDCQSSAGWPLKGPFKMRANVRLTGRAIFTKHAAYVADVTFPSYGDHAVIQTYSCFAYFNNGVYADDPTNFGWENIFIGEGINFYGGYGLDNAIICEGLTRYKFECRVDAFLSTGIWMKYFCWGGSIPAKVTSCRQAFLKLGEGSNGISLKGFVGYGGADTPPAGIVLVGDNNGIDLSGAFIEKCITKLVAYATGPMSISGVDFEDGETAPDLVNTKCIVIDGTGISGRAAGPVTISGSFLEGTAVAVEAINAIAIVTGCRIRGSNSTSNLAVAFKTTGGQAFIHSIGNTFEATVLSKFSGNVLLEDHEVFEYRVRNYVPNGGIPFKYSYRLENFAYTYAPSLPTSEISFGTSIADPFTQRVLGKSEWSVNEMRANVFYGKLGLVLNDLTGLRLIEPAENDTHSLGTLAQRFKTITTKQVNFGVGVTLASLGTAAAAGEGILAYVNDLTAPTYRAVAAGGGAVKGLVFSDGANWRT